MHRRLRPEEFAGHVELQPLLLPVAFREGSVHMAYGSGHNRRGRVRDDVEVFLESAAPGRPVESLPLPRQART